jgi:LruC domain-containing protein
MRYWLLVIVAAMLLMMGCESDDGENNPTSMNELNVPSDFSYRTSDDVTLDISVLTRDDQAIDGIHFAVYPGNEVTAASMISQGATVNGVFAQVLPVPARFDSLTIVGYMSTVTLPIINDAVTMQFGGSQARSAQGEPMAIPRDEFAYLTGFDTYGTPDDMTYDLVSGDFLQRVNASLPERQPVPEYHPDYLNQGNQLNLIIDELADVWVTFLHEGAGYRNSLGFYTYDQATGAPASPENLQHTIIFPNASLNYSGGGLYPGDKVYLGQFEAGTVIGLFLVANGWDWGSVSTTRTRYYTNQEWNPEDDPLYRQHTVLLHDDTADKFLLAFEDLQRPYGDNDFNDAVFYITSNPVEAINTDNVLPIDIVDDSDDDGISDVYDDYPTDPLRAFDNYYPAENRFGTLAFEDRWPKQGDYDLNDLVVDYQFHNVHDPQNKLLEINGAIVVRAIGAAYHNGFAIEMPFFAGQIASLDGDDTVYLENGTTHAVITVFDDAFDILPQPAEGFVNTQPQYAYVQPDTVHFTIVLDQSVSLASLDYSAPYNPFIVINRNPNLEVHLPDFPPTELADQSLFGTQDDSTNPALGRYYKTTNNYPWALHIPDSWMYPTERNEVIQGYLYYDEWAESAGSNHEDWYLHESSQVNDEFIYQP